jgi:hypothetical protein
MANFPSKQVAQRTPALSALDASALVAVTAEYVTKTGDLIDDIVEMGAIPAGCIVVDLIVDTGALGASATLDAGILSGNYGDALAGRTMDNEFFAAAAAANAGVIRRNKNVNAVPVANTDKSWGIKFKGANPAATQTIRATLLCKPAPIGI